jgi:hypothetical protein
VEEAVVCKICKAASWHLPYEHGGGGGAVRLVCLRIQVEEESSDFFFPISVSFFSTL